MNQSKSISRRLLVALAVMMFTLCGASAASAATYNVTSTTDTAGKDCAAPSCSLREAISAANASAEADVINVPAGTYNLSVSGTNDNDNASGDLDIVDTGNLTINGSTARNTVIEAGNLTERDRVFDVLGTNQTAQTVTFNNLTVRGGRLTNQGFDTGSGAGIYSASNAVSVVLNRVNLTENRTTVPTGFGGGINAFGPLTVTDSTISRNDSAGVGGGIANNNTLTVTNSTIADNRADVTTGDNYGPNSTFAYAAGGGIYSTNDGATNLESSTIAGNVVNGPTEQGSGVLIVGDAASRVNVTANGNIVANNTSVTNVGVNQCYATGNDGTTAAFNATGPNVTPDANCFTGTQTIAADPNLGFLQDAGGPTDTLPIDRASSAFNTGAAVTSSPATDQRGVTRPQLGARDIGAFEVAANVNLDVTAAANPATVNVGDTVTLTYTVNNSGPDAATGTKLDVTLPTGFSYISGTATQGSCTPGVSCEFGTLASGSSATAVITVRADVAGDFDTSATVSSNEEETQSGDNQVSVSTQVNAVDDGSTNPVAPTSTTGSATGIRQHDVTLGGSVDPKNSQTETYFEYGTDNKYGSRTVTQTVSGTSPVAITALVEGLQLGTTYHYRVVSTNSAGTTYGADKTFRTQGRLTPRKLSIVVNPKRDRTAPYTFVTSGRITLPAGVNTVDGCSGRVAVTFKRGKTTVSTRRVNVSKNCTYKSSITFKRYSRKARGTFTVQARYAGNKALLARNSSRVSARFGR